MGKLGKILVAVFALIGAGTALMLLSGLFFSANVDCTSYPVMTLDSPSGGFRIEQMQRQCKDEEGLQITVHLTETSNPDTRYGVFGAYSTVQTSDGLNQPLSLKMAWLDEKSLIISYPKNAQVFMKDSDVQGVKIDFDER